MILPDLTIHAFERGPVQTIGYIVSDERTREALIIDTPIGSAGDFIRHLETHRLDLRCIVLTHGHFDHVGDVASIAEDTRAPVWIHSDDAMMLRDPMAHLPGLPFRVRGMESRNMLRDGDAFTLGHHEWSVLHTPGHTRGGISLHFAETRTLFTGDTLFRGSIGRTDLPGGEYDVLLESITKRLLRLPDETVVYPGHGPSTTIGEERNSNPFILEYLEHF